MQQGYIPPAQNQKRPNKKPNYTIVIVVAVIAIIVIGIGVSANQNDAKTNIDVPTDAPVITAGPTPTASPTATPTASPTAVPTNTPKPFDTLSQGSKGDAVETMQFSLVDLDYLDGAIDGDFGSMTLAAVKVFQRQNGLQETGIADNDTLSLLYSKNAKRYTPTTYSSGMYKVGYDIEPGEYIILANTSMSAYFALSTDSNGDDIIANDNFDYNTIITAKTGEYLDISRAYMMSLSDYSKLYTIPTDESGVMYKVGVNIKAGEYKLISTSEYGGYYCIYDSSRQEDIVANDNFDNRTYVTVKNGQYLVLSRCKISE